MNRNRFEDRTERSLHLGFALVVAVAALFTAQLAHAATWELEIASVSGRPGELVDVPVTLRTGELHLAALSFTIRYDASRLSLAADPAAGSKVEITAPGEFTASSWTSATGEGELGVVIYDPAPPVAALPDGVLATIRFRIREGAEGFAPVALSRDYPPSGADERARALPPAIVREGGVAIASARPWLALSTAEVHFGSVPLQQTSRRTIVITNLGGADLTLTAIRIEGDASFTAGSPGLPRTLPARGSLPVELRFDAMERGERTARLVVEAEGGLSIGAQLRGAGSSGEMILDRTLIVPAVGRLQMPDGSSWVTSLAAFNAGELPARARFTLLRGDLPSVGPVDVTIPPRSTMRWDDAVGELFGALDSSGALRVETSTDAVILTATTDHRLAAGGRIGQSVPVLAPTDLIRSGQRIHVVDVERSPSRRSNLTALNLGPEPLGLRITALSRNGEELASRELIVGGWSSRGFGEMLDGLGEPVTIVIEATSENSTYFAYASTVDVATGAPVFQSPP